MFLQRSVCLKLRRIIKHNRPRANAGIIKQQHIGDSIKRNSLIVRKCAKPNNCHDDCPFIIELN
jgi:hypothetical protein